MQMFISPTDFDWYSTLKGQDYDEVNFWRPGSSAFRALAPGGLFLFKLKRPYDAIAGGGFFTSYSLVPIDLAWKAFGPKNGTRTSQEFFNRLAWYRERNNISSDLMTVGCIILSKPFFFEQHEWIRKPQNWPSNAVVGKRYSSNDGAEGERVFHDVCNRLQVNAFDSINQMQYSEGFAKYRLGQGAFRVIVGDTYARRCAISGEKTLPVLEAAHIIPCSEDGENSIVNGIFLRSDLHTLFDKGYATVTTDFRVEISKRLKQDFGNGKDYYKFHGNSLVVMPNDLSRLPARDNLIWHNNHVFLS